MYPGEEQASRPSRKTKCLCNDQWTYYHQKLRHKYVLGQLDSGGISQWDKNFASTGISITNNFLRDVNPNVTGSGESAIGTGIYLDGSLSNATISGNIITGMSGGSTTTLHGGAKNTWSGDIIYLTSYGRQLTQYVISYISNGYAPDLAPMKWELVRRQHDHQCERRRRILWRHDNRRCDAGDRRFRQYPS
jgi:hypothetical protein